MKREAASTTENRLARDDSNVKTGRNQTSNTGRTGNAKSRVNTNRDSRKLFVGGLPTDSKFCMFAPGGESSVGSIFAKDEGLITRSWF